MIHFRINKYVKVYYKQETNFNKFNHTKYANINTHELSTNFIPRL